MVLGFGFNWRRTYKHQDPDEVINKILIMRTFILLFIVFPFMFYDTGFGLPGSAIKKMDKTLETYFPDKKIQKNAIILTVAQQSALTFSLKDNNLFKLESDGVVLGYMYISDARSKFDKFDYMVIFDPGLSIITTKVLVYREDYGGEITSKRWLSQFEGMGTGRQMELGKDIQYISGATISCNSITAGINQLSKNMHELFSKGFLN